MRPPLALSPGLSPPRIGQEGLRLVRDGDVLVYADAGCTIHGAHRNEHALWAKVRGLSEEHPIQCQRLTHAASWSGSSANAEWCRADLAEYILLGGGGTGDGGGGSGDGHGGSGDGSGDGGSIELLARFYGALR